MTVCEIRAVKLESREVPDEYHARTHRIRSLHGLSGFKGKPWAIRWDRQEREENDS